MSSIHEIARTAAPTHHFEEKQPQVKELRSDDAESYQMLPDSQDEDDEQDQ